MAIHGPKANRTKLAAARVKAFRLASIQWPREPRRRRSAIAIAAGILVTVISSQFISASGLRLNLTESMPRGLYRITSFSRPLERGDLIAVCAPHSAALLGRRRGYIGVGTCPGNIEPLLKIVAAVEGDDVMIDSRGVSINGRLLTESRSLEKDDAGRLLPRWTLDQYTLQAGTLWVDAPCSRSWDSRYWGPVSDHNVQGLALPVLLLPRSAAVILW